MRTRHSSASRLILVTTLAAASCRSAPVWERAIPDEHSRILAVLHRQAAAFNRGDFGGYLEAYAPGERTMLVLGAPGTEATRLVVGFEKIARRIRGLFPRKRGMGRLSYERLDVHFLRADLAVVTGSVLVFGETPRWGVRFSYLMLKEMESWRIVVHTALGAPPA